MSIKGETPTMYKRGFLKKSPDIAQALMEHRLPARFPRQSWIQPPSNVLLLVLLAHRCGL